MIGGRFAVAATAFACLLALAVGTTAARAVPQLTVTLDGVSTGAPGFDRGSDGPIAPIDAVVRALGWKVAPRQGGAVLSGDDRTIVIVAGSRTVRENDEARIAFGEPVAVRSDHFYARAADIAKLLGLRVALRPATLDYTRPTQISNASEIVEVRRPRVVQPKPVATPRARIDSASDAMRARSAAGRVIVSLDQSGPTRVFAITSQTQSASLATSLNASGVDTFGTPTANVRFGSASRNVTLGNQLDPLTGTIFRGTPYEGIAVVRADAGRTAFAGRRLARAEQIAGETVGDALHGGATTFALLAKDGRYEQTIVRRVLRSRHAWGDFTTEAIAGDRGGALGFGARTRGRTFLTADATIASGGLPLGENDAPISVSAGRELSAATTLVGGMETGRHQGVMPFIGLATRGAGLQASLSASNRTVTANLAYATANAAIQAFVIPGPDRTASLSANLVLERAAIDFAMTSVRGARDTSLTARTTRPGINAIAGFALPAAGGAGPVAGVSIPLGAALAIDATMRPAGPHRFATRFAVNIGIPARRTPSLPTIETRVRVTNDALEPMRLFVDGTPVRRFAGGQTVVTVTRGMHTFAILNDAGTMGSPDRDVTVERSGAPVELELLPFRAVRGQLVLEADAGLPADFDLSGIGISLGSPENVTATSADGRFFFPAQPVADDARLGIDARTLPRELLAPEPQPLGTGESTLLLHAALRVERRAFPGAR